MYSHPKWSNNWKYLPDIFIARAISPMSHSTFLHSIIQLYIPDLGTLCIRLQFISIDETVECTVTMICDVDGRVSFAIPRQRVDI